MGRHSQLRSDKRVPRIRGPLTAVGTLLGAVVLATSAAGGSYAFLTATSPIGAGATIKAGTSSISLQLPGGSAQQSVTLPGPISMLPGDIKNYAVTVLNSGNTSLSLAVSLTASDAAWETRVATGNCPSSGLLAGSALSVGTPVNYDTLAASASDTICLQLSLPATVPANTSGSSVNFSVAINGTQVSP